MSLSLRLLKMTLREIAFRVLCRHQQGDKPNILLFGTRRSGSTWLLNTLAAHPGMRYVGRPLLSVLWSRWRHLVPDLARAARAGDPNRPATDHRFRQVVHFEGADERRFYDLAASIIHCKRHVHPTLNVRAPHFHRVTDRVVFQMTSGSPLIEWFDERFDVQTVVLFRHPVPTALSIIVEGWTPECDDFLRHHWFASNVLDDHQRDLAAGIMADGDDLDRHVLDWTLKMLVPFRAIQSGRHPDWLVLTYEQTVIDPELVVSVLARHLGLTAVEPMLAQVRRPSRTTVGADGARVDDPEWLLERWRNQVDAGRERELLAIPQAFGIDLYAPGTTRPCRFWLEPDA